MEFFIKNPESIGPMGLKSRELAIKKFEVSLINQQIITLLNS